LVASTIGTLTTELWSTQARATVAVGLSDLLDGVDDHLVAVIEKRAAELADGRAGLGAGYPPVAHGLAIFPVASGLHGMAPAPFDKLPGPRA
jgi:hypothetical protein